MSSCYLLDSPEDDLEGIYDRYTDVAQLSKFAGGIGLAYHRIRARGSLIKGTNGLSNGIVPWLKTLDSSVAAVNQGGRRKGAACVYLETLARRHRGVPRAAENTGDEARRTHNLNLANWVPDLFMERVEKDWQWSLFDPKQVPHLMRPVRRGVRAGLRRRRGAGPVRAPDPGPRALQPHDAHAGPDRQRLDDLQGRLQPASATRPAEPGNTVHLSNLCTEILEVTSQGETAVCNLGSVNLGRLGPTRRPVRLRARSARSCAPRCRSSTG